MTKRMSDDDFRALMDTQPFRNPDAISPEGRKLILELHRARRVEKMLLDEMRSLREFATMLLKGLDEVLAMAENEG